MTTQTKCPRCGTRYVQNETATTVCPQCAFAAAVTSPLAIEAEADGLLGRLPGLTQVGRIGRGGMGVVYRARQTRLERDVAVKVISSDFASDPEFQKRFQQEARILASLDHPNIVQVHDCGIEGALEYFVMEYVEGDSLRHLLEQGALKDPLRVVLDVSEALTYAHGRGVVHRDIKPENVIVRADGRVKVLDFGIARMGLGTTRLTLTDVVVGTPAYMAPEQRENPSAADHRVDVYALGLLAAELLTGRGPTEGALDLAGVDDAAAQVIRRATERDPARRYPTMGEMSAALRALVEPEGDGGAPPRLPMRERVARLAGSRLFWVLATGAVFQTVFLLWRLADTLPPDPKAAFERLVGSKDWHQRQVDFAALKDSRISEAVEALLGAEAASADAERAWTAVQVAYEMRRPQAIPPDARCRAMLHWGGEAKSFVPSDFESWFAGSIQGYVVSSMREAGPSLAAEVFADFVAGRIPQDRRLAAVSGLAVSAGPALVKKMRDYLIANPTGPLTGEVLLAFANRTDLPLPSSLDQPDVSPTVLDAYVRRLPGLLDEESGEANWGRVVGLVEALERLAFDGRGFNVQWWSEAHAFCREATPSPEEALARRLKAAWPLDDAAAKAMELSLRVDDPTRYAYATALLLRWRRTGRSTLPYRTADASRPGAPEPDIEEARALLADARPTLRWEAHGVVFLTVAGAPIELPPVAGEGPVRARLSREVPVDAGAPVLHIGVGSVRAAALSREGGEFVLSVEGDLEVGQDGERRFTGTREHRFVGGMGRSSGSREGRRGEAMVLDAGLVGGSVNGLKHGSFLLLVPEPFLAGDATQRWRSALAAAIAWHGGEGASKEAPIELQQLVGIAAWTPVLEAAAPLKALWARRESLDGVSSRIVSRDRVTALGDLVGAALLMLGETSALEDVGLLKRLPPEVLLRIRLFSPSAGVRRAAVGGGAAIESLQDAEAVEARLLDLEEEDATLAARIAQVRAEEPSPLMPTVWRALALLAVVVVFGCLLPWRPMRATALAPSLALLGLALRFVTIEAGGRVWFPAAGDLLILGSTFLCGGWGLRLLAMALATSGVLGLMMPSSVVRECASGHLLCAYVAVLSLDFLTRRLPGRVRAADAIALCATWWALVVPMGLLYTSLFVLGITREEFSITLVSLSGGWAVLFVAAMTLGPLWLPRSARLGARRV